MMPRRIQVEVGRNGQVKVDFSGFEGGNCYDEAEALQRILKEMGLWAIPVTVTPKTSTQMEDETGVKASSGRKVPVS